MRQFYSVVYRHEGQLFLGELNEYGYIDNFCDLEDVPLDHVERYASDFLYCVYVREDESNDMLLLDKISEYQITRSMFHSVTGNEINGDTLTRIANEILSHVSKRRVH